MYTGREANAIKSTQAILQLLWEVSRLEDLPKGLWTIYIYHLCILYMVAYLLR